MEKLELPCMRKPVFNIMNKASVLGASITANNTKINLEPLEYSRLEQTEEMNVADFATAEIANPLENLRWIIV